MTDVSSAANPPETNEASTVEVGLLNRGNAFNPAPLSFVLPPANALSQTIPVAVITDIILQNDLSNDICGRI